MGKGKDKPQLNKGHLEGTCTCFLSGAPGGPQASRRGASSSRCWSWVGPVRSRWWWTGQCQGIHLHAGVPQGGQGRMQVLAEPGVWWWDASTDDNVGTLVSSCGGNWQQNVSRLVVPLRKPLGASLSRRPAWQGWRSGEGETLETPVFKTKTSLVLLGLFVNKGPSSQGYGLISLTCMNVRVGL